MQAFRFAQKSQRINALATHTLRQTGANSKFLPDELDKDTEYSPSLPGAAAPENFIS